jgi:hypothetical protein
MSMAHELPVMDLIVALAILFAVVFLCGWMISPRLRAWIERPKYQFQENMQAFDRSQKGSSTLKRRNQRS